MVDELCHFRLFDSFSVSSGGSRMIRHTAYDLPQLIAMAFVHNGAV